MAMGQVPGTQDSGSDEEGLFSEINITPLTDIFLVLLIIFMITSSVIVDMAGNPISGGLKVQVAAGNGQNTVGATPSFVVAIQANGQLVANGKLVQTKELIQMLAAIKQQNSAIRVIIQPEDATPYRFVLGVIGIAQKAGILFAISSHREN